MARKLVFLSAWILSGSVGLASFYVIRMPRKIICYLPLPIGILNGKTNSIREQETVPSHFIY